VNRVGGEIGLSYYLEGDLTSASQKVECCPAERSHEKGRRGQIRYLAAIGMGTLIRHLTRLNAHPEVDYQVLIHEGRVLACKQLGQWKEARAISEEMFAEARTRKKYVKECQRLSIASTISARTKRTARDTSPSQSLQPAAGQDNNAPKVSSPFSKADG